MALMTDRKDPTFLLGDANHRLGVSDVVGHQLLAQDMLAGFHRFDGKLGMSPKRRGDHDCFDIRIAQHLLPLVVELDALAIFVAIQLEEFFPPTRDLARTNIVVSDILQVAGRTLLNHCLATFVAGSDDTRANWSLQRAIAKVERTNGWCGNRRTQKVTTIEAKPLAEGTSTTLKRISCHQHYSIK